MLVEILSVQAITAAAMQSINHVLFNLGFTRGAFALIPEPGCSRQQLYWAALVGTCDLISECGSDGIQNPNKIRPPDNSSVLTHTPDVALSDPF